MIQIPLWGGWIAVVVAFIAFAFLSVPMKTKWVMKNKVDPMLIQFFMSFPILIACLFVIGWNEFSFSWYGVWSAVIWSPMSCLSIFAVQLAGIGVSQGTWSGVTVITSFMWGYFLFHEKLKNVYISILGIVFLVVGIVIISTADLNCSKQEKRKKESEETPLIEEEEEKNKYVKCISLLNCTTGILFAVKVGIFNGTAMVPAKYDSGDMMFIFSFCISQFLINNFLLIPIYFVAKLILFKKESLSRNQIKHAMLPGLASGTLWCIGYYAQVIVVFSPLGLTVGMPIIQSCLILSGIVGMIIYGEFSGPRFCISLRKKLQFFAGIICIVPSFFLLGLFGTN